MLGVGELLAQRLDLAGQLGYPAGDAFRQLHPHSTGVITVRTRMDTDDNRQARRTRLDTPDKPKRVK
jgi:hypothetical protein